MVNDMEKIKTVFKSYVITLEFGTHLLNILYIDLRDNLENHSCELCVDTVYTEQEL